MAVRGTGLYDAGLASLFAIHSYVIWRGSAADGAMRAERGPDRLEIRPDRWWPGEETYAILTGREAALAIDRLGQVLATFPCPERYGDGYRMWPGPNSNTYVADLCRRARIPVDLPPTAVGKDWPDTVPGLAGAHISTTGLGVQFDLPLVGLQVGLVEGVELHLLGSALGVVLFPPAIKLPFAGRFGVAPAVLPPAPTP